MKGTDSKREFVLSAWHDDDDDARLYLSQTMGPPLKLFPIRPCSVLGCFQEFQLGVYCSGQWYLSRMKMHIGKIAQMPICKAIFLFMNNDIQQQTVTHIFFIFHCVIPNSIVLIKCITFLHFVISSLRVFNNFLSFFVQSNGTFFYCQFSNSEFVARGWWTSHKSWFSVNSESARHVGIFAFRRVSTVTSIHPRSFSVKGNPIDLADVITMTRSLTFSTRVTPKLQYFAHCCWSNKLGGWFSFNLTHFRQHISHKRIISFWNDCHMQMSSMSNLISLW